jgi:hypothetical protein
MIVLSRPLPNIKTLFGIQVKSSKVYDNLFYFRQGRDALLSGLIALGLQKGDNIIVPAYICKSAIQPLQAYGFDLVFVDIGKDLELPVDAIKKMFVKDKSIKALLIVHYFGLMQNIDKVVNICQEYGVKVVEDASHSFMSQLLRDKDSVKGDIEILSIRKSLPIVDGGVLKINNDEYNPIKTCNSQCVSIVGDIRYLVLRLFEKLVTVLGINIYSQLINNIKIKLRGKINTEAHDFNVEACQPSGQLKKYLGKKKYLQSAQCKISNNFNQLSQALVSLGFSLFVESIEDDIIPQACIIYDSEGGLSDYLRLQGIGVWQWPSEEMPEEVMQNASRYPNAILFDKKLVLLPIHQSIGSKQINYIIQVLSGWQR